MTDCYVTPTRDEEEPHDRCGTCASVGIPQGVILNAASGEIAGAVLRGRELVALDRVEYAVWSTFLTPMPPRTMADVALRNEWGDLTLTVARLIERDLMVKVKPGAPMSDDFGRLRPIALGVGLGNLGDDPSKFAIQNSTLSLPEPISLDGVAIMFWWGFDGTSVLREIAVEVASRVPELSTESVESAATRLVHGLMVNRLLYLDVGRAPNKAGDQ